MTTDIVKALVLTVVCAVPLFLGVWLLFCPEEHREAIARRWNLALYGVSDNVDARKISLVLRLAGVALIAASGWMAYFTIGPILLRSA